MAFVKSHFVEKDELWTEWMEMEKNALKLALAGDQEVNTGVTGVADLEPNFQLLKWALR